MTFNKLERFVCQMYGKSFSNDDDVNINQLRYSINCQRRMKIEALPPCKNVLKEHINRANYQTYIRHNCLKQFTAIENPEEHGWCLIDGKLDVLWMTCNPAPEEVSMVQFPFMVRASK